MGKLLLPGMVGDGVANLGTETTSKHSCMVTEYMAYMAAAGYSVNPYTVADRRSGAWRFLAKFPDPRTWLSLPVDEQLSCLPEERRLMHYLFLRHIFPVPATYILLARPRLADMGSRLMERDTYDRFHGMACRLGYNESGIRRQFQSLLCLMAWAQKPLHALTIADLAAFTDDLKLAHQKIEGRWHGSHVKEGLPAAWYNHLLGMRNVLYHLGIFPQKTLDRPKGLTFEEQWKQVPPRIKDTVARYLQQITFCFRLGTVKQERSRLFHFFSWLATTMPEIKSVNEIRREHIEAFKEYLHWLPPHPRLHRPPGTTLSPVSRHKILCGLYYFLQRITEWGWPDAPNRPLMFYQDLPRLGQALPRFLDEVEAARFLERARNHPDLFTRVCGVTLILTGLRQGEFLNLTTDCIVQIGDSHWLRVPIGKTRKDRFVPLHPEVKQLIDEWVSHSPFQQPFDFLFTRYGQRMGRSMVEFAVKRIAAEADIAGKVTPHRLRHTLATLAVNRGMPLESIAALLGHSSLSMTLVYARIANRTVQHEYSAVSERLQELSYQVEVTDAEDNSYAADMPEGAQMRRLRQEHWRMLGNGYCTRPEGVQCEYETICESCPCFSTTVEFLPVLYKQRQDAEDKGQTQRTRIFNQVIQRVEAAQ